MQLKRQEGIRHLAEELLEEGGQLKGMVCAQVDRGWVAIDGLRKVLEMSNVAVLPENAFDRHV